MARDCLRLNGERWAPEQGAKYPSRTVEDPSHETLHELAVAAPQSATDRMAQDGSLGVLGIEAELGANTERRAPKKDSGGWTREVCRPPMPRSKRTVRDSDCQSSLGRSEKLRCAIYVDGEEMTIRRPKIDDEFVRFRQKVIFFPEGRVEVLDMSDVGVVPSRHASMFPTLLRRRQAAGFPIRFAWMQRRVFQLSRPPKTPARPSPSPEAPVRNGRN